MCYGGLIRGEDEKVVVVTFRDGRLGEFRDQLRDVFTRLAQRAVGNSSGAKRCGTLESWMGLDCWRRVRIIRDSGAVHSSKLPGWNGSSRDLGSECHSAQKAVPASS